MSGHTPVMLDEVMAALAPRDDAIYVDGTFGGGGYTRALLTRAKCKVVAIDRDPAAIARGAALAEEFDGRLTLIEGAFSELDRLAGVAVDGIALDLGVSSFQLNDPERGFSFSSDGPLDMRMSASGSSAADTVNTLSEQALADIIWRYGEEKKIAQHCASDSGRATGFDDTCTGGNRRARRRAGRQALCYSPCDADLSSAPYLCERRTRRA